MQIIDSAQTRAHLAFEHLIPALGAMFNQECEVPLRHNHAMSLDGEQVGTVLIMPAWQPGKRLGIKVVTIYPGNAAQGQPGLNSIFTLFDATTGVPLALLDGNEITSRRTAAAAALAAQSLSRPDSTRLFVVGAGRVATLVPYAFRSIRPIKEVKVWDIDVDRAQVLARQLRQDGFLADAIADLRTGTEWADIVSCATLSDKPLIQGKWLKPGTHLDLIGSFTPAMREADDHCFRVATVFVDTDEALQKSGDLLEPIKSGAFTPGRLAGTLAQLCRGERKGRCTNDEITIFKAVGTALEDLAAASLVYDRLHA